MLTARQIAEEIVSREGGFVNDPDDPGGATKHGVTLGTLRRLGLDLTEDGEIGLEDVHAVTCAQAVEIFLTHYYRRPRIHEVREELRASLFDMYVNAGSHAVRILQRLLREMGQSVAVDGVIGPRTLRAVNEVAEPDPVLLRDAYGVARRNYYFRLADTRPGLRKFVRSRRGGKGGWIRRAEEFMSPRYRLSETEFQKRIAGWG
ncbi:peptidoglycan-binding protein [Ruegeria marisrubri]|uniref:Peptidoglycan-binding protein n=1 Tax=Ruegeria marisrubri TaxID=1685379 RepID=A0A117KHA6_9RHOB|nr:holin-associated N-acetylmuramidase [Ruegeria marisrubri]KUJ86235.1 peptidoglycan-binding protein [Ruegeria marisrubri]